MKIVLDTNVLISAFASRGLCADLFRDVLASHELFLSDYILNEVEEKLTSKLRIPTAVTGTIITLLKQYVIATPPLPLIHLAIRDPEDIPIVRFAIAINADLLISGDRDLLDIFTELPMRVISPREFYNA